MALTPRQSLFVAQYLVDLNASKAAERAGYSAKTAHSTGPRLLENAEVAKAIEEALARRSARVEVKQDDVLRSLLEFANCDILGAFTDDHQLLPLSEMSPEVRRCIVGIETTATGSEDAPRFVTKVKFSDKLRSLELLGKHVGMFKDKLEVKVVGLAELIARARKKTPAGGK